MGTSSSPETGFVLEEISGYTIWRGFQICILTHRSIKTKITIISIIFLFPRQQGIPIDIDFDLLQVHYMFCKFKKPYLKIKMYAKVGHKLRHCQSQSSEKYYRLQNMSSENLTNLPITNFSILADYVIIIFIYAIKNTLYLAEEDQKTAISILDKDLS